MALVPGLNIGVGILVLIILWIITVLAVIALAAVPKARFVNESLSRSVHACGCHGCDFIVSLKIWHPGSATSVCGDNYSAAVLSETISW